MKTMMAATAADVSPDTSQLHITTDMILGWICVAIHNTFAGLNVSIMAQVHACMYAHRQHISYCGPVVLLQAGIEVFLARIAGLEADKTDLEQQMKRANSVISFLQVLACVWLTRWVACCGAADANSPWFDPMTARSGGHK